MPKKLNTYPKNVQTKRKGKKSISWMEDPEILARLEDVSELVLAGYSNVTIGKNLQISEATVRRDRLRLSHLWVKDVTETVSAQRARTIANYRRLGRMADYQYQGKPGDENNEGDKKPELIRVQVDIEHKVSQIQGTQILPASSAQTEGLENAQDIKTIPTHILLARAEESHNIAMKLMEKLNAKEKAKEEAENVKKQEKSKPKKQAKKSTRKAVAKKPKGEPKNKSKA